MTDKKRNKRMRHKQLIPTLMLTLAGIVGGLFTQSCTPEKLLDEPPVTVVPTPTRSDTLTLRLTTSASQSTGNPSTRALTSPVPDTKDERRIVNLGVWGANDMGTITEFRYIENPQTDDEANTEDGSFTVKLPGWDKNAINFILMANLHEIPTADEEIGKDGMQVMNTSLSRIVSQDAPPSAPFPMAALLSDVTTDNVSAELGRSVARARIKLEVDNTYITNLSDKLKLDQAQMYYFNMVTQMANYSQWDYPYPMPLPDPNPTFYNSHWQTFANTGGIFSTGYYYLYQQYYDPDELLWNQGVGIQLQVPYVNEEGTLITDNYYNTRITTPSKATGKYTPAIFPNRSYEITLRLVGYGKDGLGMETEIECVPWTVESHTVDVGGEFTNTSFIAAGSISNIVVAWLKHPFSETINYQVTPGPGVKIETPDKSRPGETGIRVSYNPPLAWDDPEEKKYRYIDITYGGKTQRIEMCEKFYMSYAYGDAFKLDGLYTEVEQRGEMNCTVSARTDDGKDFTEIIIPPYDNPTGDWLREGWLLLQNQTDGTYLLFYAQQSAMT